MVRMPRADILAPMMRHFIAKKDDLRHKRHSEARRWQKRTTKSRDRRIKAGSTILNISAHN
eukprot:331768-Hanusia_phi.AAC.11